MTDNKSFSDQKSERDISRLWPIVLATLSVIITLIITYSHYLSGEERNRLHFDSLVSKVQVELENRYFLYEQSLRGGLGVFSASAVVRRNEWKKYVNALNIESNLPGISGVGYIDYILDKDLNSFLEQARSDDYPNFRNHPNTFYPDKFIIRFIEPVENNRAAVGLDIGFEANRRTAAERARDLAVPAITKRIQLVQDQEKKAGFLLLLPVYEGNKIPATLKQKRESFQGWVYAPFIGDNFLRGLTDYVDNQIVFTVYDGKRAVEDALIYDGKDNRADGGAFSKRTRIKIAGHIWTVDWSTTPLFVPPADGVMSLIILIMGLMFSAFLWVILTILVQQKSLIANEVERQTSRLEASEAKISAIVESTFDGMITIDGNGVVETYNKACEEIFGYSAKEVIGKNVKMLMPEPYYSAHDGYLKRYNEMSQKRIIGTSREVEGRRKNGTVFPMDLSVSEVRIRGRRLYSGVVRDITERKKAERELIDANTELEEFSYRTSHDLRSPLVSSISLLSVAQDALDKDNKDLAIASLDHVQTSLGTLEQLVKDILELTRTKNVEEEEQEVDTAQIINDSLYKFEYMDNFKRLKIVKNFKFEGPLTTKKMRFVLIVENLISNAIKYQDLDKEESVIEITTRQEEGTFILNVTDNGIGIPKDQRENLFQMFKRFHPKVSFGSGLGLYMMKKSADALNAELKYKDAKKGTSFTLSVPLN